MPASHHLWLFVIAELALLATPGPAAVFAVTRSVQHGRSAGLMSSVGLGCGGLLHVAAAVFGLSAILASSAIAFNTIKLGGAAYLIFLGFRALRPSHSSQWVDQFTPNVPMHRQFLDGLIVNVLNPKPAIFIGYTSLSQSSFFIGQVRTQRSMPMQRRQDVAVITSNFLVGSAGYWGNRSC